MTFLEQPIIYPENPQSSARRALRALVYRARYARTHEDSLRIGMIGDSTYTVPGGNGTNLAAALPVALGSVFGNIPGTPCISFANFQCGWLGGVQNERQPILSDPGGTYRPAGITPYGLNFTSGEGSHQPSCWFHKEARISYDQDIRRYIANLVSHEGVRLELRGYKQPNSGTDVLVQWAPNDANVGVSLFDAVAASEVIEMDDLVGANDGHTPWTQRYYTTPRTPTGSDSPQWYLHSNVATTVGAGSVDPPCIQGYRVLQSNPVGALVDFMGDSGDFVASWLGTPAAGGGDRPDCLPTLIDLGYDVLVFGYGTNDCFSTGATAATVRANYYSPTGATHTGLIGEIIKTCRAMNRPVPLLVFSVPPLRVEGTTDASYAAELAEYNTLAAEFIGLVDELKANEGVDAIVLNTYRHTYERGFNEANNEYVDLTLEGAYDTGGVSYAVDDYYTFQGKYYRCVTAHTSSTTTEPSDETTNTIRHLPTRVHLNDQVHRSFAGAVLEAEALAHLFGQHIAPATDRPQDDAAARATNIVPAQFL